MIAGKVEHGLGLLSYAELLMHVFFFYRIGLLLASLLNFWGLIFLIFKMEMILILSSLQQFFETKVR